MATEPHYEVTYNSNNNSTESESCARFTADNIKYENSYVDEDNEIVNIKCENSDFVSHHIKEEPEENHNASPEYITIDAVKTELEESVTEVNYNGPRISLSNKVIPAPVAADGDYIILEEGTNKAGNETVCPKCGKYFLKKYRLYQHLVVHNDNAYDLVPRTKKSPKCAGPRKKMSFECAVCSKSYRWQTDLYKHLSSHAGVVLLRCHVCNNFYKHKRSLIKHLLSSHTEQELREGPKACNMCDKIFPSNKRLHIHVSRYH